MRSSCPHMTKNVSAVLDIKERDYLCENCDNRGPNLWVCLQRNCHRIGCSEQANDHSTQHFKINNSHCVHMNLSSQRIWCYICENEVLLGNKPNSLVNLPTDITESDIFSNNSCLINTDNYSKKMLGLVGLQNIANTCYMNSALQALSNIMPLTYYFIDCADLVELTVELTARRTRTGLSKSYLHLIKDIWCKNNKTKDYIAPRGVLYAIRSVHSMFRGFQQHDTQEFLRCFMDQLHEELKESIPKLPFDNTRWSSNYTNCKQERKKSENNYVDVNSSVNSQTDSATQSEAEYETCDSGVSEQSSLFDDSLQQDQIFLDPRMPQTRDRSNANTSRYQNKSNEINTSETNTVQRSIISDVFDGKLLSSVQCLTCDRVSTREETFQDLSLPIPNRDYLNVLHQDQCISSQISNPIGYNQRFQLSATKGDLVKSDSWITWMFNIVRSWLWGPSITLHDCMASFFSADELKGDNMYSCEKCKKLRAGVKYSRILNLPEALCIHLKRFRHDLSYSSKISSYINFPMECFDMRPYLHKDCKSNVSMYNLVSVICHYGTVGGGHYTCFARNEFTNKWYEFDDQHVTEVPIDTVQNCQAYVLFYRKINPQMDLIRSTARDISNTNPSHVSDIRFYVYREWITRFNTFAEPGPINNWAILCQHGGLPPHKVNVMNKIAVPISQQLWDYIYKKFGGGPAINMLFVCEVCKRAADILNRRQKHELAVFTKYNEVDDYNSIFAISMPWLRKWQMFARGITNTEPGPITNSTIAATTDGCLTPPIRNVKSGSDYAQISGPLWLFLRRVYGGGPEIILRGCIHNEIEDNSDNMDEINVGKKKAFIPNLDYDNFVDHRNIDTIPLSTSYSSDDPPITRITTPISEDFENQDVQGVIPSKLNSKPSKQFPSTFKKSIVSDNGTSKRRIKKRRSAMSNAGFFGPTGNYSVSSAEYKSEANADVMCDADVNDTAPTFNNKSRKQNKIGKVVYWNNYELDNTITKPITNIIEELNKEHSNRSSRKKSKSKGRDAYILRKIKSPSKSSESSETEV